MVSVNVCKSFTEPSFCGDGQKNFKLSPDISFISGSQINVLSSFSCTCY